MSRTSISSPQDYPNIDNGFIRSVARAVLEGEGVGDYEISIALLDNPAIHQLNKRYLDHDEPTDVLSFPMSGPGAKKLVGELAIGVEFAAAEASERGHDIAAELALYVIHGLLHLCGEDDKTGEARASMRQKERRYLQILEQPDIVE